MISSLRLSPIQYKFWMDNQLKYPSSEFNDTNYTFEVDGDLSISTLRQAYWLIMKEFPIFYSTIKIKDGYPYFVTDDDFNSIPFHYIDHIPNGSNIQNIITSLVNKPFDLEHEYPCRFYLIKGSKKYYILHVFHHVVMDGWSIKEFFNRLSLIYNQLLTESYIPTNLIEPFKQANDLLTDAYKRDKVANIDYWSTYLDYELTLFSLPQITNKEISTPVSYVFELGVNYLSRVTAFCKENRTTPFRLYASVWALTLSKVSQANDLLVDYTVNQRPKDASQLLGVYVNNLPLKFHFTDEESSFMDVINGVNEDRKNSKKHENILYYDIFLQLSIDREDFHGLNIGINYPLFYHSMELDLDGCKVRPFHHEDVMLSADLVLGIEDHGKLLFDIRYNSKIARSLVSILADVFSIILEQVISNPTIKLCDIQMLSDQQQQKYLKEENRMIDSACATGTFLTDFKRTLLLYPNHVAVETHSRFLSYFELDRMSDNVACSLLEMGISNQRVGLSMPKDCEMLVGILGILKSGNTYVPVDYDLPIQRINFMIEDAQISFILVSKDTPLKFEKVNELLIDGLFHNSHLEKTELPQIEPSHEAYVIYTSGTTGTPKGIPLEHGMLHQTIITNINAFFLNNESRVLQFANICFDASVLEIFPTLVVGGTLVLPTDNVRKDVKELVTFLSDYRITTASIPPVLLTHLPHNELPYLKTLIIGGDTTTQEAINYWSQGRHLINSYGPAENTVDVSNAELTYGSSTNDIGVNVPGVACYVLDKKLHLLPNNVIGELYIGGIKLTKGYLNRPELNKEKFILNPFVSEQHKEQQKNLFLYKTGDLVMRRNDGHLLFMGRSDFQVKLHGYRIELGEIEKKIYEYGHAISGVVVLMSKVAKNQILVAYLRVPNSTPIDEDNLREYLMDELPSYMVPSVFIMMEEFPYNASGKVDRKRLPNPNAYNLKTAYSYQPPTTETEIKLTEIWEQLLPGHTIGRNDTFTSLGGDSLSIIQMSFIIEETFGCNVRASEVYSNPVLKQLAELIDSKISESSIVSMENEVAEENNRPNYLSPTQFSLWLECVQSESIKNSYNLPCVFECVNLVNVQMLEHILNKLVKYQNGFRMTFPVSELDGKPHISISDYVPFSLTVDSISSDSLSECLNRDMMVSFDLEKGPLFQVKLYYVDQQKYYCSLVMHHLISDGWSAKFIQSLVLNSISNPEIKLEDYAGDYLVYARECNDILRSGGYLSRIAYWKKELEDVTDLQIFNVKDEGYDHLDGDVFNCALTEIQNKLISTFCTKYGYTPFEVLSAIYLLLLYKLSGQKEFAIGFPYLGREKGKYNNVVGYFVHTLPLCYHKEFEHKKFIDYLEQIHVNLIRGEANAMSLDQLIGSLRESSEYSSFQQIQTMFAVEHKELFYDFISQESQTFALSLTLLFDEEIGYSCQAQYLRSLINEDDVHCLINSYLNLLDNVLSDPSCELIKYSIASKEYVQGIIQENLCVPVAQNLPQSFLECFAECVATYPDHHSLEYGQQTVTYRELDEMSDKVCAFIKSAGVPKSSAIGVNLMASIDAIVIIIGILKAECTYVPIDVKLPDERRDFILNDASCTMLFNSKYGREGILLNKESAYFSRYEEIAYIIYTSGTTGTPKGVPIYQKALSRLINTERISFNLTTDSRVLLFSSISFDASVTEIFTSLAAGATVVIALEEERNDLDLLQTLLKNAEITCATIPPALLPMLSPSHLPSLSTLIVGGESASYTVLKSWSADRTVINAYGPTENTIDTSMCVIDENFEPDDIGKPLPGVTCYVLDQQLNILPDNVKGELCIGGLQLTRGYLNRPELNSEKFIENPYVLPEDKEKGFNTILYKTGDIVIRRPNGHLIFKGRNDRQVKLRGFRIELSDIESQLLACEGVQRAVVKVQTKHNKQELVAYIQSDIMVDAARLQTYLRSKLPSYMVPVKWTVLQKFPMTVNGKTDWKQVPEPEVVLVEEIVQPVTDDEKLLLDSVRQIIQTDEIGVETDLLDVGMTSMQIMEFALSMSKYPQLHLTISSVYKNRTIRNILKDGGSKLYFWATPYDEVKPVFVLVCGYPYFEPFYDKFIEFFEDKFSIFVIESFNEYFHGKKEVNIDSLLGHYVSITKSVLKDIPIYGITGYCIGSEIAIRFASRLEKEHIATPKILTMDAYWEREKGECSHFDTDNEVIAEHYEITQKLFNSYSPIDYKGNIIISFSGKMSKRVWLETTDEESDEFLHQIYQEIRKSKENWKKNYPDAPFIEVDADHWTFFETTPLNQVWQTMKKNWNLKD